MLTLTLRHLERDGLLTRTIYPTIPPRVDYELAPLGRTLLDRTLLDPVQALAAWAAEHRVESQADRARSAEWSAQPLAPVRASAGRGWARGSSEAGSLLRGAQHGTIAA